MKKGCCSLVLMGLMLGVALLTGCASDMSKVGMDYGTSYQLAKHNQILNPEAEKNLSPVYGFDSLAAQATLERYEKGFEKEDVRPVYNINVGGMK